MKIRIFSILLFAPFLLLAQPDSDVPVTLANPYNTVYVHLYYLQEDNFQPELAAQTLYGVTDSSRASQLAIQLKQILDGMGLYVSLNRLPQDENYRDTTRVAGGNFYTLFPYELPEVYLERIDGRWYYSRETVSQIPRLHGDLFPFGTDILVNLLPKDWNNDFLGLKTWQWLGLFLLLLLAVIVHFFLSRILSPLVGRLSRFKSVSTVIKQPKLVRKIARYVSVSIILRSIMWFLPTLQLPVEIASFIITLIRILILIMIVLIALRVIDLFVLYLDHRTRKTESKLDEQLVPIIQGILQTIVVAGGVIQFLRILDVNVTALLAGISIGAVAIGLAAKDTVANVFGSLMIFLDKPFQIGDWIQYSGVDGTVEKVGIRATRIRTFANSLVYIPNGVLTNTTINNYGLRIFRRFKTTISITYNTPPLLIEKFVEGLRQIVASHPDTRKDYFEIHLNDFGANSLNILFYIFFEVPSWSDELRGRHEIMLAAINLASNLGVRFAFPTSTIHIEDMPGQKSLTPTYDLDEEQLDRQVKQFIASYREHFERRRKGLTGGKVQSGKSGESGEGG